MHNTRSAWDDFTIHRTVRGGEAGNFGRAGRVQWRPHLSPQGVFCVDRTLDARRPHNNEESSMNAMDSNRSTPERKRQSSLGALLVAASAGLVLLAGSAPVLAGTSNLTVVVESALTRPPELDVVSPSAATCTSPNFDKGCAITAYSVAISNGTSSNVSNAWFKATTYVFDGNGTQTSIKAPFVTVPQTCSKSADGTTIACNIGQVAAGGGSFPTFNVTVRSPSVTAPGHKIQLVWDIPSGQGASGSLSPVSSSTALSGQPAVTLIGEPPSPTKATTRSWVTEPHTQLFTGNTDIATSTNLATVKVDLPKVPDTQIAKLTTEVTTLGFCTTADFPKCVQYTLDIPGVFEPVDTTAEGYLIIILQRDSSTIKNGAKVENVVIYHSADATLDFQSPTAMPRGGFSP
jgi:hypothetical protein